MRIIVIGATGHIGSYLIPRLVRSGHEVVAVSRGQLSPYLEDDSWKAVQSVALDREALDAQGRFGKEVAALRGDIIIDLICFTPDSARQLVEAVAGNVDHLLHCGTIWVYGHSDHQPTQETDPRRPLGNYGRDKAAIEAWLLEQAREQALPVTIVHPGHIVGPGWTPLNPAGNFNPQLFAEIATGKEILLPNRGLETLHHVHADDVALAFTCAMENPASAIGESFNAVADSALNLTDYARELAAHWRKESRIRYLPLEQLREKFSEEDYAATVEHLTHSPNCSNRKARETLGYRPGYTAMEAILESIQAP